MHAMAILDRRRLAEIYAGSRDAGSSSGSSNAPKPSSKPILATMRKSKMCTRAVTRARRNDAQTAWYSTCYMYRAERFT